MRTFPMHQSEATTMIFMIQNSLALTVTGYYYYYYNRDDDIMQHKSCIYERLTLELLIKFAELINVNKKKFASEMKKFCIFPAFEFHS